MSRSSQFKLRNKLAYVQSYLSSFGGFKGYSVNPISLVICLLVSLIFTPRGILLAKGLSGEDVDEKGILSELYNLLFSSPENKKEMSIKNASNFGVVREAYVFPKSSM